MRLQHLYGADAQIAVRNWAHGVEVSVALPYHTAPVDHQLVAALT